MAEAARILVIDDDENMRAAIAEALRRAGYSVDTADDGRSGLNKMEANDYNLTVADINTPQKGGMEFLEQVKKVNPDRAVVLITAHGTVETAVEAMRMGADDYLLKPFSADALERVVRRLLGGEPRAPQQRPVPQRQTSASGSGRTNSREIITQNRKMKAILDLVERTAASRASVLIHGESGTGKELVARHIHIRSDRASGPFVAINCAALPESLLESELFGHEKGSFTGAIAKKIGKFELADKGTILLDEITEMDNGLQAKLLRVLQEKELDRVGGGSPVPIDVRVIATTNRPVQKIIEEGGFREDLYYRLNVIPIDLPALRERMDDLPMLVRHFIEKFAADSGRNVTGISDEATAVLKKCRFRGNVRELENVMERAVLLARSATIETADLFMLPAGEEEPGSEKIEADPALGTVEEMERRLVLGTLERVGDNRTQAAKELGISIRTLRNKLNAYKNKKKD
ncbi:MAG: sigma-54-dependent transcriptional regulator [Nitrospinota bacterium]